jgi:glycosyltransferase involved in cell wall biosynthesis
MSDEIIILLSTYNRDHLIIETLESIKAQSYKHFKCYITDDNSTDDTRKVVQQFCRHDKRFKYFCKPTKLPQGLSATRNYGLQLAREVNAKFVHFFDDDDIMHPNKLELQIEPFNRDDSLDMTLCKFKKFENIDQIIYDLKEVDEPHCRVVCENLLRSFFTDKLCLNSAGPLWRLASLNGMNFREDLYYSEERTFYLELFMLKQIKYEPVPLVLFWYRKHQYAITSQLYENQELKKNSSNLAQQYLLDRALELKRVPNFVLRTFAWRAYKNNDKSQLNDIFNTLILNDSVTGRVKVIMLKVYILFKKYIG